MPTPPPTTVTVTNADGSTTTTTTKFHSNGRPKSEEAVTARRNGEPREKTHKEFDRRGRQTSEKNEKFDARGRTDEATQTDFDTNGHPKRRAHAEYDNQSRPTRTTIEKFKNNRPTSSETTDFDYGASPPRKVVRSEKWCSDHQQIELKVMRVFYKRERRWHEERREKRTERYDCRTGQQIASRFPAEAEDYASIGLTAVAVFAAGAGWTRSNSSALRVALVSLAAGAFLYVRGESRRTALEEEVGDLAFALCHDDEVVEGDGEEAMDEGEVTEEDLEEGLEEDLELPSSSDES